MRMARTVMASTQLALLSTMSHILFGLASGREPGAKPPQGTHSGTFVDGIPRGVPIYRRQLLMRSHLRITWPVMKPRATKRTRSSQDCSVTTETTLNLIFGTVTGRTSTVRPLLGTMIGTSATGRMTALIQTQ